MGPPEYVKNCENIALNLKNQKAPGDLYLQAKEDASQKVTRKIIKIRCSNSRRATQACSRVYMREVFSERVRKAIVLRPHIYISKQI